MRYLLDTNACVDYLSGRHPSVTVRLQQSAPEEVCISCIVAAELRYGADKSRWPPLNHQRLDTLLGEVRLLDFDASAARAYGSLRTALERHGQPIGANDMLIAAQALSAKLIVVTDNVREFSRVRGLKVENWRRSPPRS